jgi:hypothetical protein
VIALSNQKVRIRCGACYGSLAYLAGYCPVCNDTGYVEMQAEDLIAGLESKCFEFVDEEDEFSCHGFLFEDGGRCPEAK